MKKLIVLASLTAFGLFAQGPVAITPASTGVSASFQIYARVNPMTPSAQDEGVEVPNILYIPRPAGNRPAGNRLAGNRLASATTSAPASTMYVQTTNGTLPATVTANYVGLGNGFSGWPGASATPPDTTLAVGNGQILHWVNVQLTILNKTNGAMLLNGSGYVNANQIWAGLAPTALCRTRNKGDPVVQYDRLANRWVLSQFAFPSDLTRFALCFAVSQTNDATGAYNLYEYSFGNVLPDYPKLGVWPDAYYITMNNFTNAASYSGSQVCAFNRPAMIAGTAANAVCFIAGSGIDGQFFSAIPGDFEGTIAPPANAAAYIVNSDWFSVVYPPYALRIRRFKPDFITPANSTLNDGLGGGPLSFVNLPFDNSVVGSCGDNGGSCVIQPSSSVRLDTLSLRPMYRLAYRNLGSNRESLVLTESIGVSGSANFAGIQLVEIRNPGANPPAIYNNVNFRPDSTTTSRWMGSAATDKLGNIGMGYSVSSGTTFPGIRIAGRLRNDIRSTVRGELNVKTGAGAQTRRRWGDYSTMQIDPDDDCTFWYTTQYLNSTGSFNWATQIIGFKFNSCQ